MNGRIPPLSNRMKAIIGMVAPCDLAADIGCDHGYVSIALAVYGICKSCTASDIRPGPVSAARRNAAEYGVSDRVHIRIGDGLESVEYPDCIIISGMGAETILHILNTGKEKVRCAKQLILGPQSEPEKVREQLASFDMAISEEKLILDGGKYYPLIKAVPHTAPAVLTDEEKRFGPELIRKKDPVLKEYLIMREQSLMAILKGIQCSGGKNSAKRETELTKELALVRKALFYYEP